MKGYAGFWKRLAAGIIDLVIIAIMSYALGFIFGFMLYTGGTKDPDTLEAMGNLLGLATSWLYYSVMESSPKQATPGKMALGIIVTDLEGNRVNFARATGRYFGKIISGLLLCIGYIMIAFTRRKQGLHDIMAGCLVVDR